jgi:hypothetical protein
VGPKAQWGPVEHLLAIAVDAIQVNTWAFLSANSKTKPQRPKPLHRPGMNDPDRIGGRGRGFSIEQLRRRLAESNGPNSPYRAVENVTEL